MAVLEKVRKKQIEAMKLFKHGWAMLLDNIQSAQQSVEDMCAGALGTLHADYVCGPHTNLIETNQACKDWGRRLEG